MTRGVYPEHDYAFGQLMLTLRTTIGLTQAALATALGISRQSVADWEAGRKYPKAKHLQAFIGLAVHQQAFPSGHEADEIRALWKAARQKVLLDERWLNALFTQTPEHNRVAAPHQIPAYDPRFDWVDALPSETFFGREWELTLLMEWAIEGSSRVVSILGQGGIGKSSLVINLMRQIAERFDVVIWRSLRDLPTCDALLDNLLQTLVPQLIGALPASFEQRLGTLMQQMRSRRILLVLDNLESIIG